MEREKEKTFPIMMSAIFEWCNLTDVNNIRDINTMFCRVECLLVSREPMFCRSSAFWCPANQCFAGNSGSVI